MPSLPADVLALQIANPDAPDEMMLAARKRDEILGFLREAHPREMRVLELCEAVLADHQVAEDDSYDPTTDVGASEDFRAFRTVPDAVEFYLRKYGPTQRKVVARAIERGGYEPQQLDRKAVLKSIQSAITYQLTKAAAPIIGTQGRNVLYLIAKP